MDDGSPRESLEELKFAADSEYRAKELALRAREVAAREREVDKSRWSSPLTLALIATALGVLGNGFVAFYNNSTTLAAEDKRADSALTVERYKAESSLITQAIATGNPTTACTNLVFLVKAGLLDDPTHNILRCADAPLNSAVIPVLPVGTRNPMNFVFAVPDTEPPLTKKKHTKPERSSKP